MPHRQQAQREGTPALPTRKPPAPYETPPKVAVLGYFDSVNEQRGELRVTLYFVVKACLCIYLEESGLSTEARASSCSSLLVFSASNPATIFAGLASTKVFSEFPTSMMSLSRYAIWSKREGREERHVGRLTFVGSDEGGEFFHGVSGGHGW